MQITNSAAYNALKELQRVITLAQDIIEDSKNTTLEKATGAIRVVMAQAAALSTVFKLVTAIDITATLALNAVGATGQIVTTFTPTDASNKGLNYSSSDTTKAVVDENGKVTVPSGATSGSVVITVTSADGGLTDTCTVTVTIA